MLTRLRVQGFKNLLDVEVRFGPFTCIAGPNGVGKSNLFDAILFLHLLTKYPIMEAVRRLRETKGRSPEPRSLLTAFEGYQAEELRFEADMVVERAVEDDLGVSANASISTLRYSVAFRLSKENGVERLELAEEKLLPVKLREARRGFGFETSPEFLSSCVRGRRARAPFISTNPGDTGVVIQVHQEGHGGRKVPAPKSSWTVLGHTSSSDFPTVLAAHREMESWSALLLEPSAMRAPSFYHDERTINAQGGNLAGAVYRLQQGEDRPGSVCAELANRLSELIDEVSDLHVQDDEKTETFTLQVRERNGIFHPARSLSDGTLRFLVLATLALDPRVKGIVCLEEPENGIHPQRIASIVRLLKDIAVDPLYAVSSENPLRQVVTNTHSPQVVANIDREDLVYFDEELILRNGAKGRAAAARVVPATWRAALLEKSRTVPLGRLAPYLNYKPSEGWLPFRREQELLA